LIKLGAKENLIDQVCDIVGHHHHPRPDDNGDFKVVYDADLIVNLEEKQKKEPMNFDRMAQIVEKSFLTKSGRNQAAEVLLKQSE